jgi:hypothetical protein
MAADDPRVELVREVVRSRLRIDWSDAVVGALPLSMSHPPFVLCMIRGRVIAANVNGGA